MCQNVPLSVRNDFHKIRLKKAKKSEREDFGPILGTVLGMFLG
jgi:hypothetical protein